MFRVTDKDNQCTIMCVYVSVYLSVCVPVFVSGGSRRYVWGGPNFHEKAHAARRAENPTSGFANISANTLN